MKQIPKILPAFLILIIGLGFTFWIYSLRKEAELSQKQHQINLIIEDQVKDIQHELKLSISSIELLAYLFENQKPVSKEDFQNYATPLLKGNPGIKALSWVPKITDRQRVSYQKEMDKNNGVELFERNSQNKIQIRQQHDFYFPVTFIEPTKDNENAIGYDIYSDNARKQAIDIAVKKGLLTITSRIKIVQDTLGYSFLGILPVYNNLQKEKNIENIKGLVSAVFKVDKLIKENNTPVKDSTFTLLIFDITNRNRDFIFGNQSLINRTNLQFEKRMIAFGDRTWELNFIIDSIYLQVSESRVFLYGGIFISFLLFLIALVLFFKEKKKRILTENLIKSQKLNVQTQQDLFESEEKYKASFENARDGIVIFSKNRQLLTANQEFIRLSGYSIKELSFLTLADIFSEAHLETSKERIISLIRGETVAPFEVNLLNKKGQLIPVEISVSILKNLYGLEVVFQGIVRDVSERKNALDNLRLSEEKYRFMFANNPAPMWIYDLETLAFLEINNAAEHLYGYSREEFISMTLSDIRPKEDLDNFFEDVNKKWPVLNFAGEWRHQKKNGEIITVEINSHLLEFNNHNARLVLINNITQRKQAEALLKYQKEQYDTLVKNIPIGVYKFRMNPNGEMLFDYVSPQMCKILQVDANDIYADFMNAFKVIHPDEIENFIKLNKLAFQNPKNFKWEGRVVINNEVRWHKIESNPTILKNGFIVWDGFVKDITERKKTEFALQQFKHIVSSSTDVMALIDKNYVYLAVNKEYTLNFDKTEAQFIGNSVESVFGKSFFEKVIKPNGDRCLKGEIVNYQNWFDFQNKERVYMEVFYHPYYNDANEIMGFSVNARNITKQYIAEEALKKSEENLRLSTELANVAVWNFDVLSGDMKRSRNHDKLFGLEIQEKWDFNTYINATHPNDREIQQKNIAKLVENGGPDKIKYDFRVIHPDKSIHWLMIIGQCIERNAEGIGVSAHGILMDITQRKQAEGALKQSEEKFSSAFYTSPAAMTIARISDGLFMDANNSFLNMLEFNREEVIGHTSLELKLLAPEERSKIMQRIKEAVELTNIEITLKSKFGRNIHILYSTKPLKILGDDCVLTSMIDITKSKLAEEDLKKSEENLRLSTELANVAVWEYNFDTNSMSRSKNHDQLYGLPPQPIWKMETFVESTHPLDREISLSFIQKSVALDGPDRYSFDFRVVFPDKTIHWLNVIGQVVERNSKGEGVVVRGTLMDITIRKQAEENLRLSNETIRNIVDYSPALIYIFNLKGEFLLANKNFEKLLEASQNELLGHTREKFFPKEIAKQHRKNDLTVINSKEPIFFEEENWEANGKHFYLTSKFPLFDDKGAIYAVGGISTDITERKLASEEIYNANRELQLLNNTILTLINNTDLNNTLNKILQTALEVVGLEGGNICLINPDQTFNLVAERGASIETIEDLTNNKVKIGDCLCGKCALECKPLILNNREAVLKYATHEVLWGDDIHFHAAYPFVVGEKSIGVLCVFTRTQAKPALKDLKLLESIVSQTALFIDNMLLYKEIDLQNSNLEKTVALRTQQLEYTNSELRDFAQVVSHDLKAPLRAISQLSYWLSKDYADKIDQAGQNLLSLIISRTKRLNDLIDGILQYSKAGKQIEKQTELDFNVLVKHCIDELNPPEHIKIFIDNKLPFYVADETRMRQMFQNLINNAIKYNDKPKGEIHIGCKTKNGFYEFYISDNGIGIEANYFERIFQIFQRLASSDSQEGTGIGLSLVKRIVQIYGGEVKLTSIVGKGSIFYVTLPVINNLA